MTSAAQPLAGDRGDVRTIVGGGVKLGLATAVGVVVFALLSRALTGAPEVAAQSLLILAGGAVFSYVPALWVRPRGIDGIGHAALLGTLGSLAFTVVDTAILRPANLYHWTWDAIGGGSGFWYIPIWWMGSALLATLGAVLVTRRGAGDARAIVNTALQTVGLAVLLFVALTASGLAPFRGAVVALAYALALVLHVPVAALRSR